MAAAQAPFREALDRVEVSEPAVTVFSGLTSQPFVDVRDELAGALTAPVRWRETMASLAAYGADTFVDVGPDQVLAKLVARNVEGCGGDRARGALCRQRLSRAARASGRARGRGSPASAARSPIASCPTPRSRRRSASTTTGSCGAPGSASAATPSPAHGWPSWPPRPGGPRSPTPACRARRSTSCSSRAAARTR